MPNVTVKPVTKINVKVNQQGQQTVHSTSTFYGAALGNAIANTALILAQSAYNAANTKVAKTGDTMTGNLIFTGTNTVKGTFDGGTF